MNRKLILYALDALVTVVADAVFSILDPDGDLIDEDPEPPSFWLENHGEGT